MAKPIHDPREIFPQIVDDYRGVFGEDLVSIILYGSGAGRDYRPGKSDINFMIVLSESGVDNLEKGVPVVIKWQKRRVAVPLFLSELYVETSMDVFPIEYLNFRRNYVLVFGKDVLRDLSFNPQFVRLQCEREIKGKLLLLRQAFLETAGKGKGLRGVINQSNQAFLAIFNALLYLKGKEGPKEKRGVVRTTCETFDLDVGLFEKLLNLKEEKTQPNDAEMKTLFEQYLREVRKLSKIVDAMGGGDD